MSGLDYALLDEGPHRAGPVTSAVRTLAGVGVAMVCLATGMWNFVLAKRDRTSLASPQHVANAQWRHGASIEPQAPSGLQVFSPPSGPHHSPTCLFGLPVFHDQLQHADFLRGAEIRRGWLYGVKPLANTSWVFYTTGKAVDVVEGKLICWSGSAFTHRLRMTDSVAKPYAAVVRQQVSVIEGSGVATGTFCYVASSHIATPMSNGHVASPVGSDRTSPSDRLTMKKTTGMKKTRKGQTLKQRVVEQRIPSTRSSKKDDRTDPTNLLAGNGTILPSLSDSPLPQPPHSPSPSPNLPSLSQTHPPDSLSLSSLFPSPSLSPLLLDQLESSPSPSPAVNDEVSLAAATTTAASPSPDPTPPSLCPPNTLTPSPRSFSEPFATSSPALAKLVSQLVVNRFEGLKAKVILEMIHPCQVRDADLSQNMTLADMLDAFYALAVDVQVSDLEQEELDAIALDRRIECLLDNIRPHMLHLLPKEIAKLWFAASHLQFPDNEAAIAHLQQATFHLLRSHVLNSTQLAIILKGRSKFFMESAGLVRRLTEEAAELAEGFSVPDMCTVLNALAKLRSIYKPSGPVVEKLFAQVTNHIMSLGSQNLTITLNSMARLKFNPSILVMNELAQAVTQIVHTFNGLDIGLTFNAFGQLHYRPEESMLQILSVEAAEKREQLTAKELTMVLHGFAKLDFNPGRELILQLAEALLEKTDEDSMREIVLSLHSFCLLDFIEPLPALFERLAHLSDQEANELGARTLSQLHTIDLSLRWLHPNMNISLPKAVQKACTAQGAELGESSSSSKLHREVSKLMRTRLDIPHVNEDYSTGLSVDIAVPERKWAIEVDGPTHFNKGPNRSRRFVGATIHKIRLLEAMGWRVISIPFYEWGWTTTEKLKYLREKLQ
eukprot:g80350.t1